MDTFHSLVLILIYQVISLSCRDISDLPTHSRSGRPSDSVEETPDDKYEDLRNILHVVPYHELQKWPKSDPIKQAAPIALILAPPNSKIKKLKQTDKVKENDDLHKEDIQKHKNVLLIDNIDRSNEQIQHKDSKEINDAHVAHVDIEKENGGQANLTHPDHFIDLDSKEYKHKATDHKTKINLKKKINRKIKKKSELLSENTSEETKHKQVIVVEKPSSHENNENQHLNEAKEIIIHKSFDKAKSNELPEIDIQSANNNENENLENNEENGVIDGIKDIVVTFNTDQNKSQSKPNQEVNNILCEEDSDTRHNHSLRIYNLSFLFE